MLDGDVANQILDADLKEEETSDRIVLTNDYSVLSADEEIWDLEDSDLVRDLIERLSKARQDLKADKLKSYEGHSTKWGGGGRSRLLYDQVRVELAHEMHQGRHNMTWENQHNEAEKIVRVVAARTQARWN